MLSKKNIQSKNLPSEHNKKIKKRNQIQFQNLQILHKNVVGKHKGKKIEIIPYAPSCTKHYAILLKIMMRAQYAILKESQ